MSSLPHVNYLQNFYKFLVEALKMSYFEGGSCHENAIKILLENNKFICVKKPSDCNKNNIINWIENPKDCTLNIGTFVIQPCGSNESPDIIISLSENIILPIECKSSKKPFPMYNSGGVKNDYLYIFCSKKYNKTTIYWGRDIISPQQQEQLLEIREKDRELHDNYNIIIKKADSNDRGWCSYPRHMLIQNGSGNDYFIHPDRKKCENNVLYYFDPMKNLQERICILEEQFKNIQK